MCGLNASSFQNLNKHFSQFLSTSLRSSELLVYSIEANLISFASFNSRRNAPFSNPLTRTPRLEPTRSLCAPPSCWSWWAAMRPSWLTAIHICPTGEPSFVSSVPSGRVDVGSCCRWERRFLRSSNVRGNWVQRRQVV